MPGLIGPSGGEGCRPLMREYVIQHDRDREDSSKSMRLKLFEGRVSALMVVP